jgi:hypothetical protein
MNPSQESRFRIAIAMNNIGVSLLQRGAFREAFISLKDAITLMKGSFPTRMSDCTHQQSDQDGHKLYSRAVKLLATSTQCIGSFLVECISFSQVDFCQIVSHVQQRGPSSSQTMYPVYIETLEDACTDVMASVLLYNYSLVHLCIGKQSGNHTFMQTAFRMLSLAHNILVRSCSQTLEAELSAPIVCLTALIVTCSSQILMAEGQVEEAARSYQEALQIIELIADDESLYEISSVSAAAA